MYLSSFLGFFLSELLHNELLYKLIALQAALKIYTILDRATLPSPSQWGVDPSTSPARWTIHHAFPEVARDVSRWRGRFLRFCLRADSREFQQRESSTGEQGWWATEWLADRLQLWWRQQLPTNLPTPASGHVICHIKRLAQTASSLHAEGIRILRT